MSLLGLTRLSSAFFAEQLNVEPSQRPDQFSNTILTEFDQQGGRAGSEPGRGQRYLGRGPARDAIFCLCCQEWGANLAGCVEREMRASPVWQAHVSGLETQVSASSGEQASKVQPVRCSVQCQRLREIDRETETVTESDQWEACWL